MTGSHHQILFFKFFESMQENCLGIKSPEKTKNSIENADRTMISLPIKELYNHEEFVSYHTGMAYTGQRI